MKTKMLLLITVTALFMMLVSSLIAEPNREIFLTQDFSDPTFPPNGWTLIDHAANWSRFNGANAGGSTPEVRFNWSPQFTGSTYLVSPVINTTGLTSVFLDFNQLVDHYSTPYSLGVVTRSNSGAWNTAWTANPTANIGPELKTIQISNADVGSDTFQFAFFFNGNSYNIDYWYIDNAKLYTPFPFDLGIGDTPGAGQMTPGSTFGPSCTVENVGLGELTASISLSIYLGELLVESYPGYVTQSLAPGATTTATFPDFVLIAPDEIYSFVYTVSSLEDVVDGDLSNNTATKYIETYTAAKQNVLLEIGTGGWCQYCPGAAMGADDLIDNGHNVAVVENHNGDPYATDISNGRNSYYGITGYPTAIFDGIVRSVGGSNTQSMYGTYLPLYQQRNSIKTAVELDIYGVLARDNYDLSIYVNKLARIVRPNLVLHVALTESDIAYSWQGQDHMNFVNRTMLPGLDGTTIDLMNLNSSYIRVDLPLVMGSNWVTENCEIVAWVQDLDTKEVLQAAKVWLPAIEAPPVANNDNNISPNLTQLNGNFPNPFNPSTTLSFQLSKAGQTSLAIYNSRGQLVRSLVSADLNAGTHSYVWNGLDDEGESVSSGVYYYRLKTADFESTRKMVLMK